MSHPGRDLALARAVSVAATVTGYDRDDIAALVEKHQEDPGHFTGGSELDAFVTKSGAAINPAMIAMIMGLIEAVMEVAVMIFEKCKENRNKAAKSVTDPGLFQRVALRSQVRNHCEDCEDNQFLRNSHDVAEAMLAQGREMNEEDALAVVSFMSEPENMLI